MEAKPQNGNAPCQGSASKTQSTDTPTDERQPVRVAHKGLWNILTRTPVDLATTPLLRGPICGNEISVYCPFCNAHHTHCWASGIIDPHHVEHRVPHCGLDKLPHTSRTGYLIAPPLPLSPKSKPKAFDRALTQVSPQRFELVESGDRLIVYPICSRRLCGQRLDFGAGLWVSLVERARNGRLRRFELRSFCRRSECDVFSRVAGESDRNAYLESGWWELGELWSRDQRSPMDVELDKGGAA